MRRENSEIKVEYYSEKGVDNVDRTYFAYVPLEDMACYAIAESYDTDKDINSAQLAVESVLTAFERNPSFRNLRKYVKYAHDQVRANSVKNKLEVAITVVVTDYTRIRYASCGNIKLYLLCDNAFYLKSETQTYYQQAANEFGVEKAPITENRNLMQYLGRKGFLNVYVSPKIELLEESTMLFATCSFWERIEDVELLDAYEESKPEEFLSNIQEMYLLTQLTNPVIKSYTLAVLFIEKTYKEDTAKKKKRRRNIMIGIAAAVLLVITVFIVFSIIRAADRRAISEIEQLDRDGIKYSEYGNFEMAFTQYENAKELTGKLKNNLQYIQEKKTLTELIEDRWHLFNCINSGNDFLEKGDYEKALKEFENAKAAYNRLHGTTGDESEEDKNYLSKRIDLTNKYLMIYELKNNGESHSSEGNYESALIYFKQAEEIVRLINDLDLRKELMTLILDAEIRQQNEVELRFIGYVRNLMKNAQNKMDYDKAYEYAELIVGIYADMGITDNEEALGDKVRISNIKEIYLPRTEDLIEKAKIATTISDYTLAIDYYVEVLSTYESEMDIQTSHEQYQKILREKSLCELAAGIRSEEVEEAAPPATGVDEPTSPTTGGEEPTSPAPGGEEQSPGGEEQPTIPYIPPGAEG